MLDIRKLCNIPLKSNGVTRGNRCNLLSFYCPACGMIHENYPRDKTYALHDGNDTYLMCDYIERFIKREKG